ncbi:MAG: hypothetical protein IPG64_21260 [Haliea sp.]|nr:hypothetical protein [Haliea sp.]
MTKGNQPRWAQQEMRIVKLLRQQRCIDAPSDGTTQNAAKQRMRKLRQGLEEEVRNSNACTRTIAIQTKAKLCLMRGKMVPITINKSKPPNARLLHVIMGLLDHVSSQQTWKYVMTDKRRIAEEDD